MWQIGFLTLEVVVQFLVFNLKNRELQVLNLSFIINMLFFFLELPIPNLMVLVVL